jgi:hypothetical protein
MAGEAGHKDWEGMGLKGLEPNTTCVIHEGDFCQHHTN